MNNIKYQYPFIFKILIQVSFWNVYDLGTQGQILAPTHIHIIVIIYLMKFQIDKNYPNCLITQFLQATIATANRDSIL
jgi:hypothetical protein